MNSEITNTEITNTEILSKLKTLFNVQETPPYSAITFDWSPLKGEPERINLSISAARVSNASLNLVDFPPLQIKLPENTLSATDKGASETMGLIPKTSFFYDEAKSAIFERNLADRLVACIYKLLAEGETCIILQGPIFPKLIGRLGYRYFKESQTIGVITFHPLWFPVASTELIPDPKRKFELGNRERISISEIKSHNGITEVCKTWVIFKDKKDGDKEIRYILDAFCQFPFDKEQRLIWDKKLENIEKTFTLPGLTIFEGEEIWLPFGLALAWENCRRERETSIKYLPELRGRGLLYPFEMDIPEICDKKVLDSAKIVYLRTLIRRSWDDKLHGNQTLHEKILNKIAKSIPEKKNEILAAARDGRYDDMYKIWKGSFGGVECWKLLFEI